MSKYKYYVVYPGWKPGIYRDYSSAQQASCGHPADVGNRKGFNTWKEAIEFYLARAGQLPDAKHAEWYEISAGDIPEDTLKTEYLEMHSPPDTKIQVHKQISDFAINPSQVHTQYIGRWGEEFASRVLVHKYLRKYGLNYQDAVCDELDGVFKITRKDQTLVQICWRNFEKETNSSPDILVKEGGFETFWEVKSSIADDPTDFEFTEPERDMAEECEESFWVMRVCHAGTMRAKAYEIPNPFYKKDINQKHFDGFGQCFKNGKIQSTAFVRMNCKGNGTVFICKKVNRKLKYLTDRIGSSNFEYSPAFKPLQMARLANKCDISIYLKGGYMADQINAIRMGVIRALLSYKPSMKRKLSEEGLLAQIH